MAHFVPYFVRLLDLLRVLRLDTNLLLRCARVQHVKDLLEFDGLLWNDG